MKKNMLKSALDLADTMIKQRTPDMNWMWGQALFGYALSELDDYIKEDRYKWFTQGFCDHYVKNPPRVDQADTSAPALITYAMHKKTGNDDYKKLTDRVLEYIKNEPRVMDDAVNHLGNSFEGKFYPKSIWVDSLMMFSVFPARYAMETGDRELMDFAARQPRLYAGYMMDEEDDLWYHAYWVKAKRHHPKKKIFWGRGNGWVIAALPMILDFLPEDHIERNHILDILNKTSKALIKYQRDDGFFDTVLLNKGKTYREASATALIAAGWLNAVRKGYIDKEYFKPAIKAIEAVEAVFKKENGNTFMTEISAPTIPLHIFPYLGYKFTPKANNLTYGVAAFIFAAIEYDKIKNIDGEKTDE